nr:reverse transcriptase domain-containing protein [Tanacetum cinerariifolium]
MEGPIEGGGPEESQSKKKDDPIRLDFETVEVEIQGHTVVKGKEVMDEDLRKPFKEARRTPFTRRIIKFGGEWPMPREAFFARFSIRRACFKEPYEITKIIRKDNESLTTFKERWTVETSFIMGVPKVMKISLFMDSVKSPELAKRFSDKVPITVNEMMERLDDFVRSEEAYASTELPKEETGESHRKMSLPFNGRDTRSFRNAHRGKSRRDEFRNSYRGRDANRANRARDDRASYPPPRGEYNRRVAPVLT